MKIKVTKAGIILVMLLILPHFSFTQDIISTPGKMMQMHHEVMDQPYLPGAGKNGRTSVAAKYKSSGFTMVQVNVNAEGQNIVGDAANEPSLAIDPLNPQKMVIGWRQFDNVNSNFRQAGYGYTSDGGQTWTFPGSIQPWVFHSDPVVDCDSNGNFYYDALHFDSIFNQYPCKVFKSTNGGVSWNTGVDAHGGDKQWMVIDRSGGIGTGNIYSFWSVNYSTCYPGSFTRSIDTGFSFQNCLQVPGTPYWGNMAIGNNGELYIAGSAGNSGVVVAKSSTMQDPGAPSSWDFSSLVYLDGYLSSYSIPVNPQGLVGQANIAVDHSTGPGRDNVYVLTSVSRFSNGDLADVMFAKSTDGGATWSQPMKINDDQSNQHLQWFGTMSVAPNGRIDAVWLDTRDSPSNLLSALYYSYSLDQGANWSVNEKLTGLFDSRVGWPQQDKMGDYFDMKSDETGANLAWANTFNGEEDVYYSYITPTITGIENGQGDYKVFSLTAYPNPFTDQTTLRFNLPVDCIATLTILNVYGQVIRTLIDQKQTAGIHTLTLSADDLPAGYYFCRLVSGSQSEITGLVKIK